MLTLDLVANSADACNRMRLHDQFHATRLSHPKLTTAFLSEHAPAPIPAGISRLIIVAHLEGDGSRPIRPRKVH